MGRTEHHHRSTPTRHLQSQEWGRQSHRQCLEHRTATSLLPLVFPFQSFQYAYQTKWCFCKNWKCYLLSGSLPIWQDFSNTQPQQLPGVRFYSGADRSTYTQKHFPIRPFFFMTRPRNKSCRKLTMSITGWNAKSLRPYGYGIACSLAWSLLSCLQLKFVVP